MTSAQSPSQKQSKLSWVHRALPATCSTNPTNKSVDKHAGVLEMNLFPWFCKNPSTSHFHKKTTLVNWPTDKEESNCKTRSMHKYSKLFVFQLFTSFRVFPFRLKPKSTWLHQNWNVPTNNCKCSDRIFHHLAMDHTTGPRNCSLPRKTVAAHKRSGGSWKSQLTLKP